MADKNLDSNSDDVFLLGIDVGTTSVKVSIINQHRKVVAANSLPTNATLDSGEQDVGRIFTAIETCILSLPVEAVAKVSRIGICGQVHGVCFWKCPDLFQGCRSKGTGSEESELRLLSIPMAVSNLYTWMDQRCDPAFLSSLPQPDSHLSVCSGYGCATIFWFQRQLPGFLSDFTCAGTIMDLVVVLLCGLPKPLMSTQNAAGWGYFNTGRHEWNLEILENAGFPVRLLPKVSKVEGIAGQLCSNWCGLSSEIPVGIALGDLQCSVLSTNLPTHAAFINMGTSAQIGHISPDFLPGPNPNPNLEYRPYFGNSFIVVGASLNGGNVLTSFVSLLRDWAGQLDCNVTEDKIWETILNAGQSVPTTNLQISPTIFGERTAPTVFASIQNLSCPNTNLGHVTRALCTGLVDNLATFMPVEYLKMQGITDVLLSGSTFSRNPILLQECQRIFSQFRTGRVGNVDASVGAAAAALALS